MVIFPWILLLAVITVKSQTEEIDTDDDLEIKTSSNPDNSPLLLRKYLTETLSPPCRHYDHRSEIVDQPQTDGPLTVDQRQTAGQNCDDCSSGPSNPLRVLCPVYYKHPEGDARRNCVHFADQYSNDELKTTTMNSAITPSMLRKIENLTGILPPRRLYHQRLHKVDRSQTVDKPQTVVQPQTVGQPQTLGQPQTVGQSQTVDESQTVVQSQNNCQTEVYQPQTIPQPLMLDELQSVGPSQTVDQPQTVLQPLMAEPESVGQPRTVDQPETVHHCYKCDQCNSWQSNMPSVVCPVNEDNPDSRNECVSFIDVNFRTNQVWYVTGCASTIGTCNEIAQIYGQLDDPTMVMRSCWECEGDNCNGVSRSLPLFFLLFLPILAKLV